MRKLALDLGDALQVALQSLDPEKEVALVEGGEIEKWNGLIEKSKTPPPPDFTEIEKNERFMGRSPQPWMIGLGELLAAWMEAAAEDSYPESTPDSDTCTTLVCLALENTPGAPPVAQGGPMKFIDQALKLRDMMGRLDALAGEVRIYAQRYREDPALEDFDIHSRGTLEALKEVIERERTRIHGNGKKTS